MSSSNQMAAASFVGIAQRYLSRIVELNLEIDRAHRAAEVLRSLGYPDQHFQPLQQLDIDELRLSLDVMQSDLTRHLKLVPENWVVKG